MKGDSAESWDAFVGHVRRDVVGQIAGSGAFVSLLPEGEPDIKFAVELGLAVMLDKPIIALAVQGRPVPDGIRKVAVAVIEVADMDTEAGRAELQAKLLPVLARFTGSDT